MQHHASDLVVAPDAFNRLMPAKILGCCPALLAHRLPDGPITGNRRFIWKLPRGIWKFIESHDHDHLLVVQEGCGQILNDGIELLYSEGSEIMVPKWIEHGIKVAKRDTIVLQIQPPIFFQRPRV